MKKSIFSGVMLLAGMTTIVAAQTPQVHTIATASAVSSDAFRAVGSVRELPGGKVLVNDIVARRVLLMDSAMKLIRVVVDSVSPDGGDSYGTRAGALVPFRGDTTLFVDPVAYSMLVIDGEGKVVRARSVWRAQDAQAVASPGMSIGQIGTDARGRVVYRLPPQRAMPMGRPGSGSVSSVIGGNDTLIIGAADLETRKIDTVAVLKGFSMSMRMNQDAGRFSITPVINPLQLVDEWAVLSDGRIAIVRGRDYRVEYISADGSMTSSAKLPFDWQRLSDEDKQRLVDSTTTAQQRQALNQYTTEIIRWVNQTAKPYPADFKIPEGFVPTPGLPKDVVLPAGVKLPENYLYACPPGDSPIPGMIMGSAGGGPAGVGPTRVTTTVISAPGGGDPVAMSTQAGCAPAPMTFSTGGPVPPPTLRTIEVVKASELPDFRPPFPPGSVRADRDGNLWIRTLPAKPVPGGPVFDIINAKGELADRIQLPTGYAIAGFGKNKVVYLTSRDAAGVHIARVQLK